jgi:hypothetical protein
MVGYSGTPLARKLGIKSGHRVALVSAPDGFEKELEGLPDGVSLSRQARGTSDVIVLFVERARDLATRFPVLARRLDLAGGLWVAWPKKASGRTTDLSEGVVREICLSTGLVDNKVCAVDEVWSGLRFVVRLADRQDGGRSHPPRSQKSQRSQTSQRR